MPPMLTPSQQLQRLKVGKSLTLNGATGKVKKQFYNAATSLDIKISIRHTPNGATLWRIT